MIRNLLTIALRRVKRQRSLTLLHVLGLSIGLMSCIFVWLYSNEELSFDQFHEQGDRIYRINQTFIWGDDDALFGSTGPAVMGALWREVPEFESMTRVHTPGNFLISHSNALGEQQVFEEEHLLAVDSNFLEIFTFPLLQGNPKTALINPKSIVLTASMAQKYFGNENALGKQLELGEQPNKQSYLITGVAADVPANSHIQFDFLLSMSSFPRVKKSADSWMWTTFVTFGLLREDADPDVVAQKVAAVPGKYLEAFLQKYRGISYEEFLASGEEWNLYIQPFLDTHLRSTRVYSRLNEVSDINTLYILWLIAGLILTLSMINFVNLSTAKATTRAKEVGIRKVIGSARKQLIAQFLVESFIYVVGAVIVSLFLVEFLLPAFNGITEKSISITHLFTPDFILVLFLLTLMIGLLSGLYPAFYLSSFRPALVLKGKNMQGLGGTRTRNTLVTAQFAISIAMITCTLIVRDQVEFWKNADLGFDRENKIIIEHAERLGTSVEAYENMLLQHPLVERVSHSSDTPPMIFDFDNFVRNGEEQRNISVNYLTSDEHFLEVYGLSLMMGRNFSREFTETHHIIVNEALTKSFGFDTPEDALNQPITYNEVDYKIIGIVRDFNSNLSDQIYPTAIFDASAPIFRDPSTELTVSLVRDLTADETMDLLSGFEANWNLIQSSAPFDYTFMDQEFLQFFKETIRFSHILKALASLAIFIACLGLIGLVAFVIEKRNKEIGIRKVLGASVTNIWILLSGNFGRLLLIGFVIATPLSWYLMAQWLESFPMRTTISVFTLVASGMLMLLIAVITMSFQTLKASRMNPVDYLKEE